MQNIEMEVEDVAVGENLLYMLDNDRVYMWKDGHT